MPRAGGRGRGRGGFMVSIRFFCHFSCLDWTIATVHTHALEIRLQHIGALGGTHFCRMVPPLCYWLCLNSFLLQQFSRQHMWNLSCGVITTFRRGRVGGTVSAVVSHRWLQRHSINNRRANIAFRGVSLFCSSFFFFGVPCSCHFYFLFFSSPSYQLPE